jgi:hypothetical protein
MSKTPPPKEFGPLDVAPLNMAGAIKRARDEISVLTGLEIDAVSRAERSEDNGWSIVIDLIESVARMGDNDLLSTYQMELSTSGEVMGISRLHRYHREDGS